MASPHKHTPRVLAKKLTPDQAAFMIQGAWRSRKARFRLRKMLAGVFQKVYDPTSKKCYYVNKETGEAQWTKPKMLGSSDIKLTPRSAAAAGLPPPEISPRTPRMRAKDRTPDHAASMLQGAFRAKRARRNDVQDAGPRTLRKVWERYRAACVLLSARSSTGEVHVGEAQAAGQRRRGPESSE